MINHEPSAQAKISGGTGIFLNANGELLTNVHVVHPCRELVVKIENGEPKPAKVVTVDQQNDLAVIKTGPGLGRPAVFRSSSQPAKTGENVGVVGYPLMGLLSESPKATFGQINSTTGIGNDTRLLQFSAPVQPGNSGGPVMDSSGHVIGVVVSEASVKLMVATGSIPQNINFAIKAEVAQIFLTSHHIAFTSSATPLKIENEQIAEIGSKATALIVCTKK